ncbi:hypothetical protein GCM10023405_20000 [Streptomonospora salina]
MVEAVAQRYAPRRGHTTEGGYQSGHAAERGGDADTARGVVPSPAWKNPAATPLPVPELDPPGQVPVCQGLRGTGNGVESSIMPQANSIMLVGSERCEDGVTTAGTVPRPLDRLAAAPAP